MVLLENLENNVKRKYIQQQIIPPLLELKFKMEVREQSQQKQRRYYNKLNCTGKGIRFVCLLGHSQ